MSMAATISEQQLGAIQGLAKGLPQRQSVALDPADPGHRAAITAALTVAGRTPDRYPALFAAAENGAAAEPDQLRVMDAGALTDGRATAMTWHATAQDHAYSGGTLFALDGDTGAVLATGHNSNVGEGFVPISTEAASAQPAGGSVTALSINHSVDLAGNVCFTAVTATNPIISNGITFWIDDPTLTPKYPSIGVKIALGRQPGFNKEDVDYYYYDTINDTNPPPNLIVPFVGNAQLPYPINGTVGQPIAGASYNSEIMWGTGTGTQMIPVDTGLTKNFTNKVTQSAASTVAWAYPYAAGSYPSNTESLIYNRATQVTGTTSYFAYDFTIPVNNAPTPTYQFTVCSNATPEPASPQCNKILCNVTFYWCCVAADTLITLADGSTLPIKQVDNGHRVRTDAGDATLAVEATTQSPHQVGADALSVAAVYRLETEGGHTLVATGRHPIQTPEGLMLLESIAAGDRITTVDGPVAVASCERIDFDGRMFNLKLGDDQDRADGLAEGAVGTFVANGIIVGDLDSEKAEHRRRTRDIDYMRDRLPAAIHADYESAIADIRY